jgi:hypothetical protein
MKAYASVSPVEQKDKLSKIERKLVAKIIADKALSKTTSLGREFKKQTSTAIMSAFGLIIALSWKDVITDWISNIGFVKSYGLLISAVIMTCVSVFGILLISNWAKSGGEK